MKHLLLFERFGATIAYADLPDDMQTLLFELFDDENRDAPEEFPLVDVAVSRFPETEWNEGDRGEDYARDMMGADDLPPVVIAGDNWLDGRHRVWAAKQEGRTHIQAIDLGGHDLRFQGYWKLR